MPITSGQPSSLLSRLRGSFVAVGTGRLVAVRLRMKWMVLEKRYAKFKGDPMCAIRLVNKLGDPVRGVAAKATYQIGKLLEAHPAMRHVVLQEVEQLLYRSNVSPRQVQIVCFLMFLDFSILSFHRNIGIPAIAVVVSQ